MYVRLKRNKICLNQISSLTEVPRFIKGKPGESFRQSSLIQYFLSDIYNGVVCERAKFADDGTLRTCGSDTEESASLMNRNLQSISIWTFK